jgi:hypothetical protein
VKIDKTNTEHQGLGRKANHEPLITATAATLETFFHTFILFPPSCLLMTVSSYLPIQFLNPNLLKFLPSVLIFLF